MTATVRILSPVGHVRVQEVAAATRPLTLEGLRPGILENRKANARLFMETVVDRLRERVALGELTVTSKPVAGPPSRAVVDTLRANCDFVLVGSSD
jgi:hypothetical protein